MSYFQADDGTQIYYEAHSRAVAGPVLLLLPGLLGAVASQWRPFLEPLAADFRVVYPDLRGHGRAENRAQGLRVERMAEDLIGLLNHLEVESFHVAGYSLGGYLGLMLALYEPARVHTLLLHGTKFYWNSNAVEGMRDQLDPERMAKKVPAYAEQLAHDHGAGRWRMLVRQAGDLVAALSTEGLTDRMVANIQIPVLVSVGDRDELVPVAEAYHLSQVMQSGQLLVLPRTRHPFHTVHPIPLLPVMQTFHTLSGTR